MKIDTHQFFWRYNEAEFGRLYPWNVPGAEWLRADLLPRHLKPVLQRAGVAGTIAVQVRQTLEETDWLLQLADRYPFIKGVIGWVDLCSPEIHEQLTRFCQRPKLAGVRHKLENEVDDRFMLRDDFVRGMDILSEFDTAYDLLIRPRHLAIAAELARRFPTQRFVLDHIGKPLIKDGLMSPWDADIHRLASSPNVFCKVSGMVTEADWRAWKPADFRPYLDVVFEAFGTKRIVIGSDWPECTLAASYEQVIDLVSDYLAQFSKAEQADIWGNNATSIYHIRA
jgi:L-fuconolactonase